MRISHPDGGSGCLQPWQRAHPDSWVIVTVFLAGFFAMPVQPIRRAASLHAWLIPDRRERGAMCFQITQMAAIRMIETSISCMAILL
ncbi:MAG: hypothetical protein FWG01_02010 [Betaproteobacteria bacterium]|nr:hypothetical protein [Betaproteobacteria bacterium]